MEAKEKDVEAAYLCAIEQGKDFILVDWEMLGEVLRGGDWTIGYYIDGVGYDYKGVRLCLVNDDA